MLRISTLPRLARLSSVTALFLGSALSFAQSPAPRIRGPIEQSPSIPLEGSLNPHVRLSDDLGPLAPDTPIRGISLVFARTPQQESDLQQLLAQQTDPSSPLFHHWLTPADFGARFGVASADIAATQSWLQSHGFAIDNLAHDRITFSGTAAQIQQAFAAELHRYRTADSELHFAPATELSLPPALASITAAVLHLSDFRPKPAARIIRPDYTTLTSQTHFLAPGDIAVMYDLKPLSNTVLSPGQGQAIAIVGQSYVPTSSTSAAANFQSLLGAPAASISPVFVPNSGNEAAYPGDEGEADIDIEYSSGVAPSANVFFVFTGTSPNYDVFDALAFAIQQDIAPVVSVSYGACEPLIPSTNLQQFNALFEQAAAQGQTIVAASGDNGATGCAGYSTSQGVTTAQQQQLAVSFPASSPYVTGLGGTQMSAGTYTAGTSSYWSSALNTDNTQSLLTYVPEVAWNEDSSTFGIAASGGGISSYFARPSWQAGVPGIPSGSFRLVPDIALQASISSPGYLLCTDDISFTGGASDCAGGSLKNANGLYVVAGGTSFAAPIFAGFVAVLNQYEHTQGQGAVNSVLYSIAAQPSVYATAFHDITSGTTACAAGDGNCGAAGQSAYPATTGYDMSTGLGSLDFTNLANAWPSTTPPSFVQTNTAFSSTPTTPGAGTPVPFMVLVNSSLVGGPTVPTGTLSISLDGTTVASSVAITGYSTDQASATYSVTAPSQTGSHIVIARYSGDATHLPSSGTYAFTVGNLVATGGITLSATNITMANNSTGSATVNITPTGGYNGELTWSLAASGGDVSQPLCYVVNAPTVSGPTTGTLQLGAGTACTNPSPSGARAPSRVQTSSLQHLPAPHSHRAPAAATFVALLLFGIFPSQRRRKLLPTLCTALLAITAVTLNGCGGGGGSSTTTGNNNTAGAQVYTITLTGKDSVNFALSSSTTLTLTLTFN